MSRLAAGVVIVAVVAAIVGGAGHAEAHATLVRAEPAENAFIQRPPREIILTFSETLDVERSRIVVLDAKGNEIASGGILAPDGLRIQLPVQIAGPGIYNVLWENVSTVDGHALRGSYPFTVLNADGTLPAGENLVSTSGSEADPAPEGESVAVRALGLLGLVIAVASALPAALSSGVPGRRRYGLVLAAGVAVLAVSTLLQYFILTDTGDGRGAASVLTETRLGQWWLVRAGAVALLAIAIALASRRWAFAGVVLAGAALFLAGYTATSHAAAGTGAGWAVISDYLHGAAAVTWIGAVTGLALTARFWGAAPAYRRLMPRFGALASMSVYVLLASGFLSSLVLLGALDDLWTTRYGWTLLAKLGMALPLLGVALYNARRGRRLLEAGGVGGARRFIPFAVAEVVLGGAVIFGGAMLTQSTVAKNVFERPDDRPYDQAAEAGDIAVRLQVDPNRTGLNTYTVTLSDNADAPVIADRVRLTFRYQDDQTLGASNLSLARAGEGRYSGSGPFLTLEGNWRVEVEVRRPDVDDVTGFFDVRPAGAAVGSAGIGGTWANPAAGLSWNEFAGFAALLGGIGVVVFKGRLPRRQQALGWSANGATIGLFGFGMLLLFGVHGHTPATGLPQNPIFPDADSISRGRTIYQANCAACHGIAGVPPEGLDLDPYPLDLTVHVPQHPDGQIFRFIFDGLPGTAMQAWGRVEEGRLSEEEIWHVVNYLRTLGEVDR